jgi:hypothetical protein
VSLYAWIYAIKNENYEVKKKKFKINEEEEKDYLKEEDYYTMNEILNLHNSLMTNIYSEAMIYGIQFKSRGIPFKENRLAFEINKNDHRLCNPLNRNFNNWYSILSISSWFKCRIYNETNMSNSKDYYGQFNYFFIIPKFKHDPIISGLHYSSVLLRKFDRIDYIDTLTNLENNDNNIYPNLYFIHNVNVYSTVYMLSALNNQNKPINKKILMNLITI